MADRSGGYIYACYELLRLLRCIEDVSQVVDILPFLLHIGQLPAEYVGRWQV
jgi:hypothetical protein